MSRCVFYFENLTPLIYRSFYKQQSVTQQLTTDEKSFYGVFTF